MHLKLDPLTFKFIYLSKSKALPSSLTFHYDLRTNYLSLLLYSLFCLFPWFLFFFQSSNPPCCFFLFFFHLHLIRQISSYLDDASLKISVCSLVLSRLDYYNSLYFNFSKSTLYPLTEAFNSAACLVSHTFEFSHISLSLVDLHWLPLHFRFFFKICSLMYKISHFTSPSYLSNLLLPPKRAGLRSSTRSQLFIISLSHFYAKSAFSFSGLLLWNSLFPNLKSSLYSIFLRNLKTYLFKQFIVERLWTMRKRRYKNN